MAVLIEKRPTGRVVAKSALGSCIDAFKMMRPLFLSAILISVALGLATFYLPHLQLSIFQPQIPTLASEAIHAISILVWTAVAVPVAVAVHRFILIGQVTAGIYSFRPRYTRLFFFWAAGLQAAWAILMVPLRHFVREHPLAGSAMVIAFAVIVLVVTIRLAMIFPAVAIEVSSDHWQARIAKSWKQMKGHSWLFVRSLVIAFLPWVLVYIIFWALFGGLRASRYHGDLQYSSRLGLALLIGGVKIPFVMLGAAVASWLYAWVEQKPDQS